MKIPNNSYEKDDFYVIPVDQYLGYLIRFIDLGTHEEKFANETKRLRKVHLGFELCTLERDFGRGKLEPAYISEEMTLSTGENAKLRKFILTWLGVDVSTATDFEIENLFGVPAQIQVAHNVGKNGKTYANIASVVKPMKGLALPEPVNAAKSLSLEAGEFNKTIYESLPKKMKEKIASSPEFTRLHEKGLV